LRRISNPAQLSNPAELYVSNPAELFPKQYLLVRQLNEQHQTIEMVN